MPSSAAAAFRVGRPSLVESPAVRKFGACVYGSDDSSERRFACRHVEHQRRAARPRSSERHRIVANRRLLGARERHDGWSVLHHQCDHVRFGGYSGEMAERAQVSDVTHHDGDTPLRPRGVDSVFHSLQAAHLSKTAVAVEMQHPGALFARHPRGRVQGAALEQVYVRRNPRHAVSVDTPQVGGGKHLGCGSSFGLRHAARGQYLLDPIFQVGVRNNHLRLLLRASGL